ncbi:FAD-binding oxidoreductase, partial [Acidobacteriota bacterium]
MDLARVPALLEKLLYRTTPSLVVQPKNEQDIAKIMNFCIKRNLSVFPRGTASFAFGGAVPTRNGIVVDCSPMMSILEIDPEEFSVRVQPGARWADVASKLDPYNLVPMTTPTSLFSTVAGWVSTGGLGLNSYAYGSVFDSVISVRVVRPDGTVEELDSQSRSIKNLFGTEGQFGILTEITLRVRPKPQYSGTCLLSFEATNESFDFLKTLTHSEYKPAHVVFFDRESMIRENLLFKEHMELKETIVPEKNIILLHFETLEFKQKFISSLNNDKQIAENAAASRYLWSDRYFPLKAQRIGPGL